MSSGDASSGSSTMRRAEREKSSGGCVKTADDGRR
jgi:hypothetical protein